VSAAADCAKGSATRTTWLWRLLTGADLTTELMLLCLLQLTTLLLALCAAAAIFATGAAFCTSDTARKYAA
jgi:hypothetical protein